MADAINLKRKDIFALFLSSLCSLDYNEEDSSNLNNTLQNNSNFINKANKKTK